MTSARDIVNRTFVTSTVAYRDWPVAARPAAEYRLHTTNFDLVSAASYEDYSVNWRDFSFGFLAEDYPPPGG